MENETIILIDKSHTAGFYVNVGELIKVLKNKAFKNSPDDAPVLIHQGDGRGDDMQPLTAVFKCGSFNCDKLHLQSGWYDVANETLGKKAIVYQDYRNEEDGYVKRKELIDILSTINPLDKVLIMTEGEQALHLLTTVLKCSEECPSVHLLSGYTNDVYNAN